jgi:hypothetical protein
MVFPDLDVVALTTARANYSFSEFADFISSSVKSDTSLPANVANAKLLANKILDVSTEKPTKVGPIPNTAALISGKVYRFPPNEINVKSLSLILTGPQRITTSRLTPVPQPNPGPDLPTRSDWTDFTERGS